jgi:hypothetical protein
MLEAADEKTTIVDSGELAYGYKKREDFVNLRKLILEEAKVLSAIPEIYAKRLKIGYGLWIDNDWRGRGWDPHKPEKNHFKPEELQESVKLALELTDGYVWVYSESLDWYTRRALTEPYIKAVANAQTPPKSVPESKPSS